MEQIATNDKSEKDPITLDLLYSVRDLLDKWSLAEEEEQARKRENELKAIKDREERYQLWRKRAIESKDSSKPVKLEEENIDPMTQLDEEARRKIEATLKYLREPADTTPRTYDFEEIFRPVREALENAEEEVHQEEAEVEGRSTPTRPSTSLGFGIEEKVYDDGILIESAKPSIHSKNPRRKSRYSLRQKALVPLSYNERDLSKVAFNKILGPTPLIHRHRKTLMQEIQDEHPSFCTSPATDALSLLKEATPHRKVSTITPRRTSQMMFDRACNTTFENEPKLEEKLETTEPTKMAFQQIDINVFSHKSPAQTTIASVAESHTICSNPMTPVELKKPIHTPDNLTFASPVFKSGRITRRRLPLRSSGFAKQLTNIDNSNSQSLTSQGTTTLRSAKLVEYDESPTVHVHRRRSTLTTNVLMKTFQDQLQHSMKQKQLDLSRNSSMKNRWELECSTPRLRSLSNSNRNTSNCSTSKGSVHRVASAQSEQPHTCEAIIEESGEPFYESPALTQSDAERYDYVEPECSSTLLDNDGRTMNQHTIMGRSHRIISDSDDEVLNGTPVLRSMSQLKSAKCDEPRPFKQIRLSKSSTVDDEASLQQIGVFDESTSSQPTVVKKSKRKTAFEQLAPPKLQSRKPEDLTPGVRRSMRVRMRPADHTAGQRPIYQMQIINGQRVSTLVGVTQNKAKDQRQLRYGTTNETEQLTRERHERKLRTAIDKQKKSNA